VKEFGPVTGLYTNLDAYINSIHRLLKLDIGMILPGHPTIIKGSDAHKELQNCLVRVNYINGRILEILEKRKMTLKGLTQTLGISVDEWNLMTVESHLRSLMDGGCVKKQGTHFSTL